MQSTAGPGLPLAVALFVAACLLVAPPAPAGGAGLGAAEGRLEKVAAGIANGTLSTLPPSVAWLLFDDGVCTGTLIGCRTLLSAAHCFCDFDDTGADCQPDETGAAFFQHAGLFAFESVSVHPSYVFGSTSDLAVVRLAEPVTNVSPAVLNTTRKPAPGSPGTIAGFGVDSEDPEALDGLKRRGAVTTSGCVQGIPDASHVCWTFAPPFGAPGEDSNTCSGDSGGPLFVDFGAGPVLAGVTSGGTGECDVNDLSFDADVFRDRYWIAQQAGGDLGTTCGDHAPAGTIASPILAADGVLGTGDVLDVYTVEIGAATERLRVALNAPLDVDLDLFVTPPAGAAGACASENFATVEHCEIVSPAAGDWRFEVERFEGAGPYQLTATLFGGQGAAPLCEAGDTTLCIDHRPGDARFRLSMQYASVLGGGVAGEATAIPLASLGITRGGIFAFTNPANPEVLVKVLDGCALTGRFWVFYAATTTLGFTLTVEDTKSGASKTYSNPDQHPATTITDTAALAGCP